MKRHLQNTALHLEQVHTSHGHPFNFDHERRNRTVQLARQHRHPSAATMIITLTPRVVLHSYPPAPAAVRLRDPARRLADAVDKRALTAAPIAREI
jgi:hypothetical protein